ncbi:hypothetical protein BKA81DRAFT_147164 [Phyllosticta paracitricarpa]
MGRWFILKTTLSSTFVSITASRNLFSKRGDRRTSGLTMTDSLGTADIDCVIGRVHLKEIATFAAQYWRRQAFWICRQISCVDRR